MVVAFNRRFHQAMLRGLVFLAWLGSAVTFAQAQSDFGTFGARERMVNDPWTLFAQLRGASAEDQSSAHEELFGSRLPRRLPAFEGRLLILQLDLDPHPEAVLILDVPSARVALVLDRDNAGWWKVGRFTNWVRTTFSEMEEMIEIRSVSDSVNQLVVRRFGWMTEGRSIGFQIFRLDRGILHQVFETVELSEGPVAGAERDTVKIEKTYVYFPKPELIIAHRLSAQIPGFRQPDLPEEVLNGLGKTTGCAAHEWSAKDRKYVESPTRSKEFCGRIGALRTRRTTSR